MRGMPITRLLAAAAIAVLPWPLKPTFYRLLLGARIGRGVRVGFGTLLLVERLELGDQTRIGALTLVRAAALITGKHVSIGSLSRIDVNLIELRSRAIVGSRADIAGDWADPRSAIRVGMHSWIFERCYINVVREVTLGRNVGVGGATLLFTHGYWLSELDGFPVKYAPVTIGDDVWLPWDCFIMPGVTIGSRVVVGAKSLVMKDVPEGALIGGAPAKILRDRSYREVSFEEKREMLRKSCQEFAARRGLPFAAEATEQLVTLAVGGRPLLAVHATEEVASVVPVAGALNVVRFPLDRELARRAPCLSLAGYASSSAELLGGEIDAWLAFARGMGLRFYPWDEE